MGNSKFHICPTYQQSTPLYQLPASQTKRQIKFKFQFYFTVVRSIISLVSIGLLDMPFRILLSILYKELVEHIKVFRFVTTTFSLSINSKFTQRKKRKKKTKTKTYFKPLPIFVYIHSSFKLFCFLEKGSLTQMIKFL